MKSSCLFFMSVRDSAAPKGRRLADGPEKALFGGRILLRCRIAHIVFGSEGNENKVSPG